MIKKEITLLISSLRGGGAESVCTNIANGLANREWNVNLVVLNMNGSIFHDRLNQKVNLISLNINHARYSFMALSKYLFKQKPSVIMSFNYELTVSAILIKNVLGVKTKIIARNNNTLTQKTKQTNGIWVQKIVNPMIKRFYSQSDHIINQCEGMKEDLLSFYPNSKLKLSTIYNPVNTNIENLAKTIDFNKISKQNYLLCIGRLEKQKAFHYALEAFAKISGNYPGLRLKILGKGSLENDMKRQAFNLGIADKVDFEGFQKDIADYILNAKATLLTSLYEGFPNVLIESIALGTPVVAFDCKSGPREIIQEGLNGYLSEYQNTDDLSKNIGMTIDKKWDYEIVAKSADKYRLSYIIEQYENKINNL